MNGPRRTRQGLHEPKAPSLEGVWVSTPDLAFGRFREDAKELHSLAPHVSDDLRLEVLDCLEQLRKEFEKVPSESR